MKFIRMEVEHRHALALAHGVQRTMQKTTRQQAEIASAGDREAERTSIPGSQGILVDRAARGRDRERMAGRLRDAVTDAWQWKHARVVAESQLDEDLETPVLQVTDRELGSAKPEYRLAGKVLEPGERALHIRLEGGRLQAEDQLVAVGVAPDLMPAPRHLPHESGIRLGDVANHKERRAGSRFVQHIE